MRKLLIALLTAAFATVTIAAYAADNTTQPPTQKHAKKKKKSKTPGVSQSANPMDKSGQGAPQSSGTGGVQAGGNEPGRGAPTGTAAPGGAISTPLPKGAGRSDNQ
jgi:hypothetical protein